MVSRLLNAKPLRRVLADHPDRDVALIVSSSLYRDVVSTGFCALDPDGFQAVRVIAKGVLYHGFIQRTPSQPLGNKVVRAPGDDAVLPLPVSTAENSASALVPLLSKILNRAAATVGEQLWASLTALVQSSSGLQELWERVGRSDSA